VKMQIKSSEVFILVAAALMSFLANLPDHILGSLVDRRMLLSTLTALVVVALFRYLQALLLLTISILSIGANIPAELASALGISQLALIVSLAVLIAITLLNRVVKLLPVESEAAIADWRQAVLNAVAEGDEDTLLTLMVRNESVNFLEGGTTPLHLAAEKGYVEIERILIKHGADFHIRNAEGKTPLEVALDRKKFLQVTSQMKVVFSDQMTAAPSNANTPTFATSGQAARRHADTDIWQGQYGR
jgi:hypothetical protein